MFLYLPCTSTISCFAKLTSCFLQTHAAVGLNQPIGRWGGHLGLANHMPSFSPSVNHFVQKGERPLYLDPIKFGCAHRVFRLFYVCFILEFVVVLVSWFSHFTSSAVFSLQSVLKLFFSLRFIFLFVFLFFSFVKNLISYSLMCVAATHFLPFVVVYKNWNELDSWPKQESFQISCLETCFIKYPFCLFSSLFFNFTSCSHLCVLSFPSFLIPLMISLDICLFSLHTTSFQHFFAVLVNVLILLFVCATASFSYWKHHVLVTML